MTTALIQKSSVQKDDMAKINMLTRKELSESDVYTFNISLCNNDVDRDFEKFSVEALYQLSELFVGKTGICDHSMKSSDQKARIYDTFVEKCDGEFTQDGEELYILKGKAYMLNNDDNKQLIDEIDAGIKKEVSVSCSIAKRTCSICQQDKKNANCSHIAGRMYDGKLCYTILSDAQDAYEFSFVAVPAQRNAGVTKSFDKKETVDMESIVKTMLYCDDDITISKSQARQLHSYIETLKEEAALAQDYKKQLSRDVIKLFTQSFPDMDTELLSSVVSVMTTKELLGFKNAVAKKNTPTPKPQLAPTAETKKKQNNDFSQFKI